MCVVPSAERVVAAVRLTCPVDPAHGNLPRGNEWSQRSAAGAIIRERVCQLKKQLQVIRISDLLSISTVHRSSSISGY